MEIIYLVQRITKLILKYYDWLGLTVGHSSKLHQQEAPNSVEGIGSHFFKYTANQCQVNDTFVTAAAGSCFGTRGFYLCVGPETNTRTSTRISQDRQ